MIIYEADVFKKIKDLNNNSIDLIVTSPPYADTKSYGKNIKVLHPDNYVDWIMPLFPEMYRIIKPTGSIIFNIDDKCVNKLRHIFVFDLIVRLKNETDVKLYDYYIWSKQSCLPNGNEKRLNHRTEWIFHFVKDQNKVKWNMDNVREPYNENSIKRSKRQQKNYYIDDLGKRKGFYISQHRKLNKKGKVPFNVFKFPKNNELNIEHPAVFHLDLPRWYIKALTDEGDIVLDPFMGSGTTGIACYKEKRKFIGIEKNPIYVKIAKDRIDKVKNKITIENFL